jgi:hypothetical protein
MKTIKWLTTAILLFGLAACIKDSMAPTGDDAVEFRKKESVTLPFKMHGCAITDPALGGISCSPFGMIPKGGGMEGNATFLGFFKASESPWWHGSCEMIFDENGSFVKVAISGSHGWWTAANGDRLNWEGSYESFGDGTWTCDLDFTGGTGRFEDVSGNITALGWNDPENGYACARPEGYITFPK